MKVGKPAEAHHENEETSTNVPTAQWQLRRVPTSNC